MTYESPPLRRPEDTPPILTQDDLCHFWRSLMGPLGFGRCSLWFIFIEPDGQLVPNIHQIEDMPPAPADEIVGLIGILGRVLDGSDLSVAALWSRPGVAASRSGDLAWARGLTAGARAQGLRMWPIHLAGDDDLRVFAPDELAVA